MISSFWWMFLIWILKIYLLKKSTKTYFLLERLGQNNSTKNTPKKSAYVHKEKKSKLYTYNLLKLWKFLNICLRQYSIIINN